MISESSINDLYVNTVKAFPKTTKRQHSIDEIRIIELKWTPFVGLKTLLLRGLAENISNKQQYDTISLFKNIVYGEGIPVFTEGKQYLIKPISENDVLVKCNCLDYYWRLQHYNFLDHVNYGRNRKKYIGKGLWQANPMESSGMCKHLIKMITAVKDSGLII